ncbi:MAG: exodeoxyribonuclease V subunit gamma [Desulfofustis sp.]|nr:exodeoxyribonuclease V subunit gamma [Desulfofustis sp.]
MFALYTSNRTEVLAEQLAAVISETGGQDLFTKAIFLVQSREMERMLSQFLADRFGVWGNSKYLLPMQFIEYVCQLLELDLDSGAFDRSILTWRLELLLRDLGDRVLLPLRAYLSGPHTDLKRYQFAKQLAHLFDQYQIMRPELIRAWDAGHRVTLNSSEEWQLCLWKKLREGSSITHRGELIGSLITHLEERQHSVPAQLQRLFVFGLHTLPPQFLKILTGLATSAAVHFFLLAPCSAYWGDMESRRLKIARESDDGMWPDSNSFHPLLVGLGRQGADFQDMLLEQVEEMIEGPDLFVNHDEKTVMPVLHRLQNGLLNGNVVESDSAASCPEDDDSVVVVSCHSRMRETAVLKDHILKWLTDNPDLGLHDIVVMAPDIQLYADLIPALFKDLPHDISDCRKRRDNRYVEIFLQFLELFRGRFTSTEIFSLLDQPEVGGTFAIGPADLETIKSWLRDVGIRWGLSGEQRYQDGLAQFEAGTWDFGLERMLFGLATGSKDPVGSLIPHGEIEGGDAELLGRFCEFIEVIELSRRDVSKIQNLRSWSSVLHDMARLLFGPTDTADYLALEEMLAGLADPAATYHDKALEFEVIRTWFEFEADAATSVDFLRGRLTFCSMLPMRSIPFKVICLLGLNDREFPKQDRFLPFNLLTEHYEKGDRSQRADDRYQFLEAIMAARSRLYISYLGQSIRTNAKIPPSPVVTELLEAIAQQGGSIKVCHHPLQPFDGSYFSSESELFSHHRYYCTTAKSFLTSTAEVAGPWFQDTIDPPIDIHLRFADLLDFAANPQRYFVRRILQMTLRTEVELLEDSEPFALDPLERYLVSQELVEVLLDDRDTDIFLEELQQRQLWPLGFPGRQQFQEFCGELEDFAVRVAEENLGMRLENLEFDTEVGSDRLSGIIDSRFEKGQLIYRYGNLRGRDLLRGWLHHLALGKAGVRNGPTKIVLKNATISIASDSGASHNLEEIIELFRAGCRQPSKFFAEAAFVYCQQLIANRSRGRTDPLAKAIKALDHQIDNGYVEELSILFAEPRAIELLDKQFEEICHDFLLPVVEQVEIDTNV